jgi:hypothetical protein
MAGTSSNLTDLLPDECLVEMDGDRFGVRVRIDFVGVVDRVSGGGCEKEFCEYKEGDGGVRGRLLVLVVEMDEDADPERSL